MNVSNILKTINGYVWGGGLIFLLLSAGLIYTLKLRFIQFRMIPFLLKGKNHKDSGKSGTGISQLKTVTSSLGTAMGTGNIIGVASAIAT